MAKQDRRAAVALGSVLVIGALAGAIAFHASCLASDPADVTDAVPADTPTDVPFDTAAVVSADAATDADGETARNGDGWIDGEYCPDPFFPPRTDGCPCDPGNGAGCRPAQVGKVCDYYLGCTTSAHRFTCQYVEKFEMDAYYGYQHSTIPCPSDTGVSDARD